MTYSSHVVADKNYAYEWFEYGLHEGNEFVIKFMMHWISFNFLYSQCGQGRERDNIIEYCITHYDELSTFDAYSTDEYLFISSRPVYSATSRSSFQSRRIHENLRDGTGVVKLTNLILTIYQVRCNLFHGSKSLHIERDLELVYSSAILMEGFMDALIKALFPNLANARELEEAPEAADSN